ncbi:MAG: hypothetical protein MJ252_19520 [archaeon]|nr:hypothetical protein [archaeon]
MSSGLPNNDSNKNSKSANSPLIIGSNSNSKSNLNKTNKSSSSKITLGSNKMIRDISPFRKYNGKNINSVKKSKSNLNIQSSKKQIKIEGDLMGGSKTDNNSQKNIKLGLTKNYSKPKIGSSNPFLSLMNKHPNKSNSGTFKSPVYSPYANKDGNRSKTPQRPTGGINLGVNRSKSPSMFKSPSLSNTTHSTHTPSSSNRKLVLKPSSSFNKGGFAYFNCSSQPSKRAKTPIVPSKSKSNIPKPSTNKSKSPVHASTPKPFSSLNQKSNSPFRLTKKNSGSSFNLGYNKNNSTTSFTNRSINMANLIKEGKKNNNSGFGTKKSLSNSNFIKVSGKKKPKTTIITMNINQEGTNNVLNISTGGVQGNNVINVNSSNNSNNSINNINNNDTAKKVKFINFIFSLQEIQIEKRISQKEK